MTNEILLFNTNCLEVLKGLESDSVDLILTDPPYNLGNFMRDRQTNLKKMRENFFGDAGWDDLEFDEWKKQIDDFFKEANRVLKKRGSLIMFMSIIKVESIISIASKHKFYYKTTGIWHKTNPMPRNMNLHFINSTEAWLYFINEARTGTFNNNGKAFHDFIETSGSTKSEKQYIAHPTQKPEKLFEHFVSLLTNPNDTVLDPFMGSGTSGVVTKKLGRNFIGCEINSQYFEGAKKRIDQSASQLNFLDLNISEGK